MNDQSQSKQSQPDQTAQNGTGVGRDQKSTPRPFRKTLARMAWALSRPRNGAQVRDSIQELIATESDSDTGAIPAGERELISNILKVHGLTVEDVMVPRADIVAVEASAPLSEVLATIKRAGHTRLPVFRGTLDECIGMVHAKDLLTQWGSRRAFKLEKILRKVLFTAPSMSVLDLLAEMRQTRLHLALVVDEFGGIDGLVTIEDLVEEIVGEIEDEHDEQAVVELKEERPGVATADARVTIEDFEAVYGPILTEEEREDVDTLGGLVYYLANRIPARGELIRHSTGIEFEVLAADPRRIRRLRLRHLPDRISSDAEEA